MEAWLVAIAAVVALALVSAVAFRSRGTLARIETAAAVGPGRDPVVNVAGLRDRAERGEAARALDAADQDLFLESLTQGVLTVGDNLRIIRANAAAHAMLDRAPGSLLGRSLIEVFLDTQVEGIAQAALTSGSATGEFAIADTDGRSSCCGRDGRPRAACGC